MDIRRRLAEIETSIQDLNEEKEQLEMEAKWTPEAIGERIRVEVEKRYGKGAVKLALLKVNSEYNDEGYDYSPNLILVDSNYDEIIHNMDPQQFMPTSRENSEFFDRYEEDIEMNDIKVKF